MDAAEAVPQPPTKPTLTNYVLVYSALIATIVIAAQIFHHEATSVAAEALVPAMSAMFALTAVVWLLMAGLRNLMVTLGRASMRYYHSYANDAPAEWIERPARTFNNLMQVPPVFYAVCLITMALDRVDTVQVSLAWMFVGLRVVHALIMLAWNFVPYRFAAYNAAMIALVALAFRVAARCWPQ